MPKTRTCRRRCPSLLKRKARNKANSNCCPTSTPSSQASAVVRFLNNFSLFSLSFSTAGLEALNHPVNVTSLQANVLSELTYFQILKYQDQFRAMF